MGPQPGAAGGAMLGLIGMAVGAVVGGLLGSKQEKYNQKIAQRNRDIKLAKSAAVQKETSLILAKKRRLARRFAGKQRAAVGKQGTTGGGSVEDILNDSSIQEEEDIINIAYQGRVKANNLRTSAADSSARAEMSEMKSQASLISGGIRAGTAFIR